MGLYSDLIHKKEKLAVIGLGYVGLPLAVQFSDRVQVIGFDTNADKIRSYQENIDVTREIGDQKLNQGDITYTCEEKKLGEALMFVVAVPTPVNTDKTPNLEPLKGASKIVGRNLRPGAVVVYESTVFPGATEEICGPILEQESGLKCGVDFKIGYSPERINPSDKEHVLANITKVVSGMDPDSLEEIAQIYELVALNGVFKASNIKVAEAAKVIENSQRDINIAFMNELSVIFHNMGIDTLEVLEAASTKWNFLNFTPGLVGGHCIGVDPYYLTHKAESLGYHSQVILSGRRINDSMGKYIAENMVKTLIKQGIDLSQAKVAILGFAFKENCQDTRNTKVIDIVDELLEFGIKVTVIDPVADREEANALYGVTIEDDCNKAKGASLIAVCVKHKEFDDLSNDYFNEMFSGKKILFDIKGAYSKERMEKEQFVYWRL